MLALDTDQTGVLSRAFDRAWEAILTESAGKLTDIASTRELIAKWIVLLAKAGETDERRLARSAILYVRTQQTRQGTSEAWHAGQPSVSATIAPNASSAAAS